jgi:hypothetical protein
VALVITTTDTANFSVLGGETCDCFGFGSTADTTGYEARMEIHDEQGVLVLALSTLDGTLVNYGTGFVGDVSVSVPNVARECTHEVWVDTLTGSDQPQWTGSVSIAASAMEVLP